MMQRPGTLCSALLLVAAAQAAQAEKPKSVVVQGGHVTVDGTVSATIEGQPLQVESVDTLLSARYQQTLSLTWNNDAGRQITGEFPVFGDLNDDAGIPAGAVLELHHVGLRITDLNEPPVEGVHCLLRVRSGNTGRNLNASDLPIVATPVPNSQGIGALAGRVQVASQPIIQYHFSSGQRPLLTCLSERAPGASILVTSTVIGRLRFDR